MQHLPIGKLKIAFVQESIAITVQKILFVSSVAPPGCILGEC